MPLLLTWLPLKPCIGTVFSHSLTQVSIFLQYYVVVGVFAIWVFIFCHTHLPVLILLVVSLFCVAIGFMGFSVYAVLSLWLYL
jgi:hypothetical protein